MKILIEKILIIYLIVGVAIAHTLHLPETTKGFIGMFSFLVIPYLVGNIFFQIKILKDWSNKMDIVGYSFLSWLIGNMLIAMMMTSLYAINLFDIFLFSVCFLIFIVSFYIYYFYSDNRKNKHITLNNLIIKYKNINIFLLVILLFSIIFFMLYFNPFPLWREWDFFLAHSQIAQYITDLNQVFRSFAYFNTFSIGVAINSYLFDHSTFTSGWMVAHFIFPFIFFLGMYYFLTTFKIKKETIFIIILGSAWIFATKEIGSFFLSAPKTLIFLSTPFVLCILKRYILPIVSDREIKNKEIWVSIFIFVFILFFIFSIISNQVFYLFSLGPIHYLYISLILTMFFIITFVILKNKKDLIRDYYLFLFTIILGIFFIHINMGLVWNFIFIGAIFFMLISNRYPNKGKFFIIIFSISTILILLLQKSGLIDITISNLLIPAIPSLSFFIEDFSKRFENLTDMWPLFFWFFFFIGVIFVIFKFIKSFVFPIGMFLLGVIIFLFILDVGMYRLIVLIYFLGILYVAVGIQLLYKILLLCDPATTPNKIGRGIFYLCIAIIFIVPAIGISVFEINKYIEWRGHYSIITEYEYDAGNWIKSNLPKPKNTIIISDPRTQFHVSAFSYNRIMPNIESIPIDNYIYFLLSPQDAAEIYDRIQAFMKNESITKYYGPCVAKMPGICIRDFSEEWIKIEPNITSAIVIVNGRTVEWMNRKKAKGNELFLLDKFFKMNEVNNADKFLNKFLNETYFTHLYNNSEIYIFGVNPEPSVQFKVHTNKNETTYKNI